MVATAATYYLWAHRDQAFWDFRHIIIICASIKKLATNVLHIDTICLLENAKKVQGSVIRLNLLLCKIAKVT